MKIIDYQKNYWIKKLQKTYDKKHEINKLKYFCITQPHNSQIATRFSFNDNFHSSDELTQITLNILNIISLDSVLSIIFVRSETNFFHSLTF